MLCGKQIPRITDIRRQNPVLARVREGIPEKVTFNLGTEGEGAGYERWARGGGPWASHARQKEQHVQNRGRGPVREENGGMRCCGQRSRA